MEGLSFILQIAGTAVAFAALALAGDQIKALAPLIAQHFVRLACLFLPECTRDRYQEEWLSNIDQLPGGLWKLWAAIGCFVAIVPIARHARGGQLVSQTAETRPERAKLFAYYEKHIAFLNNRASPTLFYLVAFALVSFAILKVSDGTGERTTDLVFRQFSFTESAAMADRDLASVERHKYRFAPWSWKRLRREVKAGAIQIGK